MDNGINRMEKQSHDYLYKEHKHEVGNEGSDVERTLKMVTSGFTDSSDNIADVSIRCITCIKHIHICVCLCVYICIYSRGETYLD